LICIDASESDTCIIYTRLSSLDLRLIFFLCERDGHFFLHIVARFVRTSHCTRTSLIAVTIRRENTYLLQLRAFGATPSWTDHDMFPFTYDRYSSMKYILNTPSKAFETLAPATPHRPGTLKSLRLRVNKSINI